jgi:hypothetical protein
MAYMIRVTAAGLMVCLGLMMTGCGAYEQVNQGWQGATSPSESGQQGAYANQAAHVGSDAATSKETNPPEKKAGKE